MGHHHQSPLAGSLFVSGFLDAICYNADQADSLLKSIIHKSKHTIVISTAIVYSPKLTGFLAPDSEIASDSELGKYGREKIQMEAVWMNASAMHQHPVTILRPPHIVGEGSLLGVIPLHNRDPFLLRRLQRRQPLLLADGGRQLMQVVFNQDIANVIFAACGNPATFGKIYNCANPEIITGRQYFETVANLLSLPLQIQNIPSEVIWESDWGWASMTISRLLSMDSLYQDVGYVPNTLLKTAIRETLTYLIDHQLLPDETEIDPARSYLESISADINLHNKTLKLLLSEYARDRLKSPVDLRMNADPPNYRSQ
jgi:nucleoside-diphosphate-sugar epimerase